MTETEWWTSTDPRALLRFLRRQWISPRKLRLFSTACCRRVWRIIPDSRGREAVELAELYAEGLASDDVRGKALERAATALRKYQTAQYEQKARQAARAVCGGRQGLDAKVTASVFAFQATVSAAAPVDPSPELAAEAAAAAAAWSVGGEDGPARGRCLDAELAALCDLLRDIFGNPHRPVVLSPECRTPVVMGLAQAAYDERAMPGGTLDQTRLTILADALEDAGCSDAGILSHLRGPESHLRGCWVLDLLLGKE